ncbi:MAG: hypothetical protein QM530_02110, partial [Phycisphaerales bacterium]|nr:hypothetical protein [Phycisphaerales bacterium]
MKKISFMMVAAGLLATSALTSCKKEEVKTAKTTSQSNGALNKGGGTKWYDWITDNCIPSSQKTCLDEVVVRPHKLVPLDAAIAGGGGTIATLFSNQTVALELIPEFNDAGFAPIRAAILSGNYNFDKTVNANTNLVHYILGPVGNINHAAPLIVLEYSVQP